MALALELELVMVPLRGMDDLGPARLAPLGQWSCLPPCLLHLNLNAMDMTKVHLWSCGGHAALG